MKKLLPLIALSAVALAFPFASVAADPKPAKSADSAAPGDESKKSSTTTPPGAPRAIGMLIRVDSISATAKTFTHKNADGTKVKHVVTETTEIKNGDAPAKFEEIKVGDTVSGSRRKRSPTEYEVVKISRFGPAPKEEKGGGGKKKR